MGSEPSADSSAQHFPSVDGSGLMWTSLQGPTAVVDLVLGSVDRVSVPSGVGHDPSVPEAVVFPSAGSGMGSRSSAKCWSSAAGLQVDPVSLDSGCGGRGSGSAAGSSCHGAEEQPSCGT